MEKELFLPESVDEQIEHLAQMPYESQRADERLVHDTYTLYQEYEHSRDRVWARLQERMDHNITLPEQELPAIEHKILPDRRFNRMKQHVLQPGQAGVQRFGLIAAVIFAALLIGGMIEIVQMAHHTNAQTSTPGSAGSTAMQQNTTSDTYVGSSNGVRRLDAKTGKTIWTYKLPAAGPDAFKVPTVIPAGNAVYIKLMSFAPDVKSAITALNAQNGHVLWSRQFDAGSEIDGLVFNNGTIYGDVTYSAVRSSAAPSTSAAVTSEAATQRTSSGTTGSIVYALNAINGKEQSIYRFTGDITDIAVSSGVLYTTTRQNLSAINLSNKKQLWSTRVGTGSTYEFLTAPRVANGTVFTVLDTFNRSGIVFAYNAHSGAKLWHSDTISTEVSNLTVTNNAVYFGSAQGTIYAYDAQHGHRLWNQSTSGPIEFAPVVANGVLYTSSFAGSRTSVQVLAFNASNGQKKWSAALNGGQILSLALSNNMIYLSTCSAESNTTSKVYGLHNTNGSAVWTSTIQGSAETISVNP